MPSKEHDDVVALLRALNADRGDEPEDIEETRQRLDATADLFPVPAGVEIEPLEVEGISCERYQPASTTTSATILYLHGGAYVGGSLRSHRPLCARIAEAVGAPLLAVDYRLAPEHPHPAALDDAATVYRWLLSTGHEPGGIVLAGDSAGGGLAAATLLSLHATDAPMPAGALLISPWLDLTLTNGSITDVADADPMLDASSLARSASAYAGADLRASLVSPVFAGQDELAAMPPMLLLAGTADILVDDSRDFAARARAAGADVDVDIEDDLIHVWPFIDGTPEASDAMARIASWVRARVRPLPLDPEEPT